MFQVRPGTHRLEPVIEGMDVFGTNMALSDEVADGPAVTVGAGEMVEVRSLGGGLCLGVGRAI